MFADLVRPTRKTGLFTAIERGLAELNAAETKRDEKAREVAPFGAFRAAKMRPDR
jgi:hypothetical protein